ncbi:hypothetical protein AMECASPLE_031608 [Ameca splendens]|uniref:Uncharacterized protein n=1 Tax=Ameca splendens TaxID=208324 RepID=A0ABV0ZF43_9TELE
MADKVFTAGRSWTSITGGWTRAGVQFVIEPSTGVYMELAASHSLLECKPIWQLQVETKFLLRLCSQVKSTDCKLLIFISWCCIITVVLQYHVQSLL